MYIYSASSQIVQWVKNLSAMQKTQETQGQFLGWEDPLEKGMATHSSILAWRIPWTAEPGRLQSIGSQIIRQDWSDWAEHSTEYCFIFSAPKIKLFSWLHDKSSKVWRWSLFEDDVILKIFQLTTIQIPARMSSVPSVMSASLRPLDCSTLGFPFHHQLPEHAQTPVHQVSDVMQPSHPGSSPSSAFYFSQHQGLFKWVTSSYQLAKVLEFQLQHQSFQWTFRTDFL